MSEVKLCPILSLPDELLCHIFSYIRDIHFKLMMESVCKRFQMISSTQSTSWSIDTLAMNVYCSLPAHAKSLILKFNNDCTKTRRSIFCDHRLQLNGLDIKLKNWPQAITQVRPVSIDPDSWIAYLKRAKIRNLCLHIDVEEVPKEDDLRLLRQSFFAIKCHSSHVKLKYLEFHRRRCAGLSMTEAADEVILWCLDNSQKSLTSVILALEERREEKIPQQLWMQICSSLEECPNLKSFAIEPAPTASLALNNLTDTLVGKPLSTLAMGRSFDSQVLLDICKGSTALEGIKSLGLGKQYTNLSSLCEALDARTRESLEEILIELKPATINFYLSELNRLPLMFPNLKSLCLDSRFDFEQLEEDLLFNTDFFHACEQTPDVDRKVAIYYVVVDDEDRFRERLEDACEEAEINLTVFSENNPSEVWGKGAILKKGHGTIELCQVEEKSDDSVSYVSDSNQDDDMDDG